MAGAVPDASVVFTFTDPFERSLPIAGLLLESQDFLAQDSCGRLRAFSPELRAPARTRGAVGFQPSASLTYAAKRKSDELRRCTYRRLGRQVIAEQLSACAQLSPAKP